MPVCLQDSIDCLMNAAIAAGNYDFVGAPVDVQLNLLFNVSPASAFNNFMIDFVGV